MRNRELSLLALLTLPLNAVSAPAAAADADENRHMARIEDSISASLESTVPLAPMHLQPCVGGFAAGVYPCNGIDLLEFMPLATFGASVANSGWGWTDALDGREYYLLGLNNGTAFIDISDPEAPVYLGKLPTHAGTSNTWRDVRVYQNHAFIVSEQSGHGMQVFDLTQLRNVPNPPVTFGETAFYDRVSNTHTISINEATGYAYLVGTTGGSPPVITCGGNMHIVDISTPASPQFVACYNDDAIEPGYVHENQCFLYDGPDATYDGHEICLAARGSAHDLDILDVTNHAAPVRLSSLHFNNAGYSHQAWFTGDQRYVLLNDELDEDGLGHATYTWIFDVQDLDAPVLAGGDGFFAHSTPAIDHNLYVVGNYVTESNYAAGLRILELSDLANAELDEVAFFDVYPANDAPDFNGTWNHYPYFASGVIPVTHIQQGLFLLKPSDICLVAPDAPTGLSAAANGDNRIDLAWSGSGAEGATFRVERAPGGCEGVFETIADATAAPAFDDLEASGGVLYGYRVRELTNGGSCASLVSSCVTATTSGACTQAPSFAGIASATDAGTFGCTIDLAWLPATPWCGGPASYSVYRGSTPDFVPAPGNRIVQELAGVAYSDAAAPAGTSYYVVRAADAATGAAEQNGNRAGATATGPPSDGSFSTGAEIGDPALDTGDATIASPEHAGWHITSDRSHAPSLRSFWSTAANNMCVTLEGSFSLTAGESSSLSFWTAWDIEPDWDGGVIDISTNGGTSWTRLTPAGGYPGTINSGGSLCGIAPGSGAFTGYGNLSFGPRTIELSAYAGLSVRVRWLYRTDTTQLGLGWYVDDIALTHVQAPGACMSGGLFLDDFESGAFGPWSEIVP